MNFDKWIENANKQLRKENIPHKQRPLKTISLYSTEFNIPVVLNSDVANKIFTWYTKNSKPNIHQIGSSYESVFYYDSQYWIVSIPIIYGTVELDTLNSLIEMPESIKTDLQLDKQSFIEYSYFWCECLDYSEGINIIKETTSLNDFGKKMFFSALEELNTSIKLLKQNEHNSRVMQSSRMATEMFLKSYLALNNKLTDNQAKKLGHNLEKSFDKFLTIAKNDKWIQLKPLLKIYPDVNSRYDTDSFTNEELWKAFSIAHTLGIVVVREFTDCHSYKNIFT